MSNQPSVKKLEMASPSTTNLYATTTNTFQRRSGSLHLPNKIPKLRGIRCHGNGEMDLANLEYKPMDLSKFKKTRDAMFKAI